VWDFLFDRGLDLSTELPPDEFCVCITREAEFEIPPIPDSKKQLKNFIYETIKKCTIETKSYFGFHNYDHPQSEQRVGGFGVGSWISQEELSFIKQQKTKIGTKKKESTKLYNNEADVSIAARSLHSIVLTLDAKKGPINEAYKNGGEIIYLKDFDESNMSLKQYILKKIS
jgi:hypothetical protein